jgi:hypothetical protein
MELGSGLYASTAKTVGGLYTLVGNDGPPADPPESGARRLIGSA